MVESGRLACHARPNGDIANREQPIVAVAPDHHRRRAASLADAVSLRMAGDGTRSVRLALLDSGCRVGIADLYRDTTAPGVVAAFHRASGALPRCHGFWASRSLRNRRLPLSSMSANGR